MPAKEPVISPRREVKESQIPGGGASVNLQFVSAGADGQAMERRLLGCSGFRFQIMNQLLQLG
jgi:hypothetical protein